jgi:hypothetical protein
MPQVRGKTTAGVPVDILCLPDGTVVTSGGGGGYLQGARAYHNAAQVAVSGTPLALAMNSERYDTDTIHDLVTNNSRLTCKTAGKYLIGANVEFAAAAAVVHFLSIRLGGATYIAQNSARCAAGAAILSVSVNCIYDLAVGNYVEAVALQTSGGNLNVNASGNYSPEFWMQRIG